MTTQEIIDFYVDLLIAQYSNKPRARGTVAAYVSEVVANKIFTQVRDAFDLDTAVGLQLDVLGSYRGVPRNVFTLTLTKDFFFFATYAETPTEFGFALYSDADIDIDWFFITYPDVNAAIFTMTDSQYREVIKFVAAVESSSFSLADIDVILLQFFGVDIELADNGNMTMTYTNTAPPNLAYELVRDLGFLPKPAGVEVIFVG